MSRKDNGVKKRDNDNYPRDASEIDRAWLQMVTRECQRFVGSAVASPRHYSQIVRDFLCGLPDPRTSAEESMLRWLLFDLAAAWGQHVHLEYHAARLAECAFSPTEVAHSIWRRSDERRPKHLFVRWTRRFWPAFLTKHPATSAARLTRWIDEHYRDADDVRTLARRVGCHHAMLRRQFSAEVGMSIVEYRNRVRVERALTLFVAGEPAKSVADEVGWGSRKNLYRAIQKYAGLAPGSVTPDDLKALLDRLEWERQAAGWRARHGTRVLTSGCTSSCSTGTIGSSYRAAPRP